MRNLYRFLIAALLVLLLLFILPFLIPTKSYIPKLEQLLAETAGVPAQIGGLNIAFLPSPRLRVEKVSLGDKQEVTAKEIAIVPALFSLFSGTKVISQVVVTGPIVSKESLNLLAGLAGKQGEGANKPAVIVRKIIVNDLTLVWPDMNLPLFNASVVLDGQNHPESGLLKTTDGALEIDLETQARSPEKSAGQIEPANTPYYLYINATHWSLPLKTPFLLDDLKAEATLAGNALNIKSLEAKLYEGTLNANAVIDWSKAWHAEGKFKAEHLSLHQPLALISQPARLSGHLFGNGSFNSTAKAPDQLLDHLRVNFPFRVEGGVLYGLDLIKAASLLLKQGQRGGQTQFDDLSGVLAVDGHHYQLDNLKVSSGLIAADGKVSLSPKSELDGVLNVAIKNSLSLTAIPLQVSGTLAQPVVLPTKAALAGAVAGTAVLGPGVGTSLGIKAGSAVDKIKGLFGGGKK